MNHNVYLDALISRARERGIPAAWVRQHIRAALMRSLWAILGNEDVCGAILDDMNLEWKKQRVVTWVDSGGCHNAVEAAREELTNQSRGTA